MPTGQYAAVRSGGQWREMRVRDEALQTCLMPVQCAAGKFIAEADEAQSALSRSWPRANIQCRGANARSGASGRQSGAGPGVQVGLHETTDEEDEGHAADCGCASRDAHAEPLREISTMIRNCGDVLQCSNT